MANNRQIAEWSSLVNRAHKWLADRWGEELAQEQWVSEAQVFQLLKSAFRGYRVERHAQLLWLGAQHLDCYLPELRLAIEYMGPQHYGPVEFFGGSEGFRGTVERDERKKRLCAMVGIRLEYVRFDENMGQRVDAIRAAALPDAPAKQRGRKRGGSEAVEG